VVVAEVDLRVVFQTHVCFDMQATAATDLSHLKARLLERGGEDVIIVFDASVSSWTSAGFAHATALEGLGLLHSALAAFHVDNRVFLVASRASGAELADGPDAVRSEHAPGRIEVGLDVALLVAYKRNQDEVQALLPLRIVVLTATPVASFITGMNCAFAAQKMDICVDVMDAAPVQTPTAELVQLAQLTDGVYLRTNPSHLVQHVLHLVPDARTRADIAPIPRPAVDLRAVCFCHRNPISEGLVCSVCLAVYCELPRDYKCPSCGSRIRAFRPGEG
jgi:hypothetical protein